MSVQPINWSRTEVPLALAKNVGLARAPEPAAAPAAPDALDQATLSDHARQLSAALAGQREVPKLHLSPSELRALISKPERR